MEKRTSATARILASLALIGAVVAIIVVVGGSSGSDPAPGGGGEGQAQGGNTAQQESKPKTKAKTYVVKTGDNLTVISEKTGVSVAELQALNPEVDPQVLVAGETLKLR